MKLNIPFLLLSFPFLPVSCTDRNELHTGHKTDDYYTCPMHPSVQSPGPGACPVCNMSLIKVEKRSIRSEEHGGNFITLDARQQLLAGIETDTAKFLSIIPSSTLLGTVSANEEQVSTINSRVKGRIDKLFVKSPGEFIRKGQPVYGIYSEELLAAEKEFITLSEKIAKGSTPDKFLSDMLRASKNKLFLWGLTENQILALEKDKTGSPLLTFFSPSDGYVTDVRIKEGMYVETGMPLIKLTGLKQVWVETQVYTNDKISGNTLFRIMADATPNEIYSGRLVFINPSVEGDRKIQLLRLQVDNPKNQLIPGMMVYVSPMKTTKPVLAVPKSTVLLEKMKTVWIKTDATTFEQRMVETGTENRYFIEVLSGIKDGEIVVTSGAYLISSEFILKSGASQRHAH